MFNKLPTISKTVDSLKISIDPRIELLSSMLINADYPYLSPFNFEYKEKMKEHFSRYKDHKIVSLFETLLENGFAYHAPVQVMLYLSDELLLTEPITDEHILRTVGGKDMLTTFACELKNYFIESNFSEFYMNNIDFYEGLVDDVSEHVSDYQIIPRLEDFFGYGQNAYSIILSPVSINGGYGIQKKIDNTFDAYAIIGALGTENNSPTFYNEVTFEGHTCDYLFTMLIWHEFGHTFINPLTDIYSKELNKYSKLFLPVAEKLAPMGYGSWHSFINEQIIEAIVAKLVSIHENPVDAEISTKINREYKNFIYIDAIYEKLDEYLNNRVNYPTFKSFYPEFIKLFEKISKTL